MNAKLLQSWTTLCDPMDCSLLGTSVHEILQARILQWVAMPSSRGSSQCTDWIHISWGSCTAGRYSTTVTLSQAPTPPARLSDCPELLVRLSPAVLVSVLIPNCFLESMSVSTTCNTHHSLPLLFAILTLVLPPLPSDFLYTSCLECWCGLVCLLWL